MFEGYPVGILVAVILGLIAGWVASRANDKDRAIYDPLGDEEASRLLLLHIRQDVKLIAFLL